MAKKQPLTVDPAEYVITRLFNVLPAGEHLINVAAAGVVENPNFIARINIKPTAEGGERGPQHIESNYDEMRLVHRLLSQGIPTIAVLTVVSMGTLVNTARTWAIEAGVIRPLTASEGGAMFGDKFAYADAMEI